MIYFTIRVRFEKLCEGTTIDISNHKIEVNTNTRWSGRTWHQDKMILWRGRRFMKGHWADYDHNKASDLFGHKIIYIKKGMLSRQIAHCIQCGQERGGADEFNGYPCQEPKRYYRVAN